MEAVVTRRRILAAFAALIGVLGLFALTARPAPAGTPTAGFNDELVVTGLSQPIGSAFLPDGRMLVIEKGGDIELVVGGAATTIATVPVCTASEMGLLGIAVDPNFAGNGYVYLFRTDPTNGCASSANRFNQIVRVTMTGNTINLGSMTTLLGGFPTDNGNHDGGVLRIGPDGKLYAGVGDTGLGDNIGGPGSSTNPYAQDIESLAGKIVRINLDGTIPGDNPFVGVAGRDEIFAVGFRNPFRMGFDHVTGDLWVGDVGDLTIEEVDIVTSGGNYAWPHCEATLPGGCQNPGDIDPVFSYPHSGAGALGSTVIGGADAPASWGSYAGQYFFADFINRRLYRIATTPAHDGVSGAAADVVTGVGNFYGSINDIIYGPDGALYYTQLNPGEVRRVTPAGFEQPGLFGQTLTMTETATRKTLNALAKESAVTLGGGPGSADDPSLNGATVEIRTGAAQTLVGSFPLANAGWSYTGPIDARNGLKYKAPNKTDPITNVRIRQGKMLQVKGKGAGLTYSIATDPNPVTVSITFGGQENCMTFGGTVKYTAPKKFTGKKAPRPFTCP